MTRLSSMALALAALAALPAGNALGQGFGRLPYDYVNASLAVTELDSIGVELGVSFEVADQVIVFGAFEDLELSDNVDRRTLRVGGGYRWPMRPNMDFVAKLAYADNEIDFPGPGRFDDEGLVLSGEFRGWISQRLELSGELLLDDSIGSDIDTVLEFGAQQHRRGNLSLGGRVRVDEDDTTLLVGARFYFGASNRRGAR